MRRSLPSGPAIAAVRVSMAQGFAPAAALACPRCGGASNRLGAARRVPGYDDGSAWAGRGDLQVVEIEGACGAYWDLCVGVDGDTVWVFARVIRACTP